MMSSQVQTNARPSSLHGEVLTEAKMPGDPRALIAPLLSGLSFSASHGYYRRGPEISIACRFSAATSGGMVLEVYPEGQKAFDLEGISFRIEIDGDERRARVVTLNRSGIGRIEEVSRSNRMLIKLLDER